MMSAKIIFILNSLSQPRCIRRIIAFDKADFDIVVYGFDRKIYNENLMPDHIPTVNLGFLENGQSYLKRIFYYKSKLFEVFKRHKNDNAIYYVMGMDIAFFACFWSQKAYVYEIGDIRYSFIKNKIVQAIFHRVDTYIIKRSKLTVLITEGFRELLLKNRNIDNIYIQPNRLSSYFQNKQREISFIPDNKKLRFAYVGFLGGHRDLIYNFACMVGKYYPQHSFLFYGDGGEREQIKQIAETYPNVQSYGAFKNPEDLQCIYENIDLLIACYDPFVFNQRVAEPNKFYEALFFGKPVIVSKGTFLEKKIIELGCGYAIDANDEGEVLRLIDSLTSESLNKIKSNINVIPRKLMIDDDAVGIIEYIRRYS